MLTKIRKSTLVLTILCGIGLFTRANDGIAVTLLDYRLDTTLNVNLGYTLTISARVTNSDTANAFFGVLDFGVRNSTQDFSNTGYFNKPPYSSDSVFLAPGETVPAVFSIDIDIPYFVPGPDVVVVWPISDRPIADSIYINLNIIEFMGIQKKENDDFGYFVSGEQIFLRPDNGINFKQVRIYSITGQVIAQFNSDNITEVPVPDMPRGIYLCELITAENKRRVFRFVH